MTGRSRPCPPLHGLGGTKTLFEATGDGGSYNNRYFAERGYAVVTPTARGFGDSCGTASPSRTPAARAGWTRLGDMRYEVRDFQTLVGRLVDEGVADPSASARPALLRRRLLDDARLCLPQEPDPDRDGGYAPWRSPKGTPISLAAAWPRWLWSNGESIFIRNGRGPWSRTPPGVEAQAYAGWHLRRRVRRLRRADRR